MEQPRDSMNEMNNDRVLITGAAGFIGSHLAGYLRRSVPASRVFSLVHRSKRHTPQTFVCDLTQARALRNLVKRLRPTIIFHAAGASHGTAKELLTANVVTSANLLDAAAELDPGIRVVLLGSAAEFGASILRNGSRQLAPISAFGWSKACQSLLAVQRAAQGQNVVVARLYNLTGPRLPTWFVPGSIAYQIAEAEAGERRWIRVGNLEPQRDFLDVHDAVRGIVLVGQRGEKGKAYDVCSGKGRSIRDILNYLVQESPRRLHIKPLPWSGPSADAAHRVGDPAVVQAWGWVPQVSLQDSLRDTLFYYRADRA
jgi:GDP-4-dehydro-6-deoxy-D-mannose reductase